MESIRIHSVIPETGAATVSFTRAAELLNIPRSTAYELKRQGRFPVPVLRVSERKWVVAVARIEEFLSGKGEVAS